MSLPGNLFTLHVGFVPRGTSRKLILLKMKEKQKYCVRCVLKVVPRGTHYGVNNYIFPDSRRNSSNSRLNISGYSIIGACPHLSTI